MFTQVLIVFLLILLNGFFALSEMAVVTARTARLKAMADTQPGARRALTLQLAPERFLSTVQIGITLIPILTGVFGGSAFGSHLADWLTQRFQLDPQLALGIGMTVSVGGITFATILLGELLPKRIALIAPEAIATAVALPMTLLARITAPAVWALASSLRLLLRLLGLHRGNQQNVSAEEIRLLVAESHEQGVIDDDERNMVNRVLRLGDRDAESLMTPRTRIAWLDSEATLAENLETMRETPYSRYPVYRGSDQEVLGVLEAKALAGRMGEAISDLFAVLKPPLFVSESTRAMALLEIFRDEMQTLALVVDEYGDIQGLVTVNDLLGAVIGRLQHGSEHDEETLVVARSDGSYLVDGGVSTDDLQELLSLNRLPDDDELDYNTVAGLIIAHFGRIPNTGEWLDWAGWRFEVVDLDGARVDKLLLTKLRADPPDSTSSADASID